MKNEIYTVATENNCDYGIRVIVCEDAETATTKIILFPYAEEAAEEADNNKT